MRHIHLPALLTLVGVVGACSGEVAKDATAAVVGKSIEIGKGTVTGIAAGIDEGRKSAESADGALVVSSHAELAAHGGAKLGEVVAREGGSAIDIVVENTGDKPMRASRIDVIVLDKNGIVAPHTLPSTELTVPPRAKAKLQATSSLPPEKVGTIRLYGQDLAR